MLKPVVVSVPDLGQTVELDYRRDRLAIVDREPDIEIRSQPLFFLLSNNFGLQTLGVSGRYRLLRNWNNWFRHRALLAMLNAGIGLAPARIVSPAQLKFFWRRRRDLFDQLRYRVRRSFKPTGPAHASGRSPP